MLVNPAELNRFPGFGPSILEAWEESFPDDSKKLEEFTNLPGLDLPLIESWQDEGFTSHDVNPDDLIFQKSLVD